MRWPRNLRNALCRRVNRSFLCEGRRQKQREILFPTRTPLYNGLIVLLVDGETAGSDGGACCRLAFAQPRHHHRTKHRRARGGLLRSVLCQAARFSASPWPKRSFPMRTPYPNGVSPDLPVALPEPIKQQIFQQSLTKGMAAFVFETDRPHFNEAALVAGTNPEIEAAQAAQQRRVQGGENLPRCMMRSCSAGSISLPRSKSTKSNSSPAP